MLTGAFLVLLSYVSVYLYFLFTYEKKIKMIEAMRYPLSNPYTAKTRSCYG